MAEKSRGLPLLYLKAWRVKKFLGQSELADKAGLARATITRAERGDEIVSFANIRKLAEVLGIRPDDLLREPKDGE
ncbi:MAG TPA: helix-turn-helix transcriptional regulator [Ktedonobacterales bacterium]|nr:helix-turn-helix transcriptional regulator [Ktedonobacterales bacterium]